MGEIFRHAQSAFFPESTSGRGGTAPILLLTSVLVGRPDRFNPDERAASAHYTGMLISP